MPTLRWGLVGAGDIAVRRVAPALRDAAGSELVAVSRRRAELAEEFAQRFGARRAHPSWEDLVRDPEIDAVYVATPVDLHARVTMAAAGAGKHVLCEKPMALSVGECDAMIDAAERGGVKLGIAYYRHLYPLVRRVAALLREGAIGEPVLAQVAAFDRFDPAPGSPRAWLLDPRRAGGGPMFDFGCHRIELLLKLLGPVDGVAGVLANRILQREVEDTAGAVFRFRSGAVATLVVTHAAALPRDTVEIHGTRGSIHLPTLNGAELRMVRDGEETVEQHPAPANLHQPLVEQFVRAVLDGEEPAVDGRAGREVNRLLALMTG